MEAGLRFGLQNVLLGAGRKARQIGIVRGDRQGQSCEGYSMHANGATQRGEPSTRSTVFSFPFSLRAQAVGLSAVFVVSTSAFSSRELSIMVDQCSVAIGKGDEVGGLERFGEC